MKSILAAHREQEEHPQEAQEMSVPNPVAGIVLPNAELQSSAKDATTSAQDAELVKRNGTALAASEQTLISTHPTYEYVLAARVLTAIAAVTAAGTFATGGVLLHLSVRRAAADESGRHRTLPCGLASLWFMLESFLCIASMTVCVTVLFVRPQQVLVRRPDSGRLMCLCTAVFVLFLLGCASFGVLLLLYALEAPPLRWPALCLIPGVRLFALLDFFVLVLNSLRR